MLLKEKRRRASENDFWEFCLYIDYDFFTARKEVLKDVAYDLQDVELGIIDIYYVGMPPRTGKSYITSLFCAWSLGRTPQESIMRNSHSYPLYEKFSNDIRAIIKSDAYIEVFPEVQIERDRTANWLLKGSRHGISYFGGGVGTGITGFGCSKIAILDDSVKDESEALSETVLDKKWGWYTSVHRARMEKGCKEIHIATRWSKKDIPGRLIEEGVFNDKRARTRIIPALVDGKSFCEDVKSTKEYLELKRITDELIWEAEYMQNPIDAKGLLFNVDELKRFKLEDLKQEAETIIGAGDIADEGMDFLSVPIAKIYNNAKDVYIIDVKFTNESIEITQPETAVFIDRHNPSVVEFESNNGGKGFAMEVKRLKTTRTHIKWKVTTQNKHTRIIMKSGQIKEHFYFRDDYKPGSDYDKFMRQLITYNKQGTAKFDDAADSVTKLAEMLYNRKKKLRA